MSTDARGEVQHQQAYQPSSVDCPGRNDIPVAGQALSLDAR